MLTGSVSEIGVRIGVAEWFCPTDHETAMRRPDHRDMTIESGQQVNRGDLALPWVH